MNSNNITIDRWNENQYQIIMNSTKQMYAGDSGTKVSTSILVNKKELQQIIKTFQKCLK